MQWFVAEKNRTLGSIAAIGFLGVLICGGLSPTVIAEDTQIGVSVCGQNTAAATVAITEPNNDSVVNQAVVTFRGTVTNASQIEVSVDNQYSGTLAIGANQTSFSTDVALSQGTHTIQITASAICSGPDAIDSAVITYTPAASEPSTGLATPTQIDQQMNTISPAESSTQASKNDIIQQAEHVPVIGPAVNAISNFATGIGLTETLQKTNAVSGIARVGLTVTAVTSILTASSIAPAAAHALPGLSHVFNIASHRSLIYFGWVIRGAGLLAMALAYFI